MDAEDATHHTMQAVGIWSTQKAHYSHLELGCESLNFSPASGAILSLHVDWSVLALVHSGTAPKPGPAIGSRGGGQKKFQAREQMSKGMELPKGTVLMAHEK